VISELGIDWWRQREPSEWNAGTRIVETYEAAGGLELVDESQFRPGLRLVSAPGHRQGHCVVLLGDELVHGADLLHHALHVEHPEWDGYYDEDVPLALATRRQWYSRLAESETPVVFAHVPERGRIVGGPKWQPDSAGR
jgi:glyoxylase-like metal-dependent hydrolase (beta-lactamase superfamily II)